VKRGELPSIYPVACHTDNVGPGSTFVVIKGYAQDGATFIPQAIAQGATRIVVAENDLLPQETVQVCSEKKVSIERVANPRERLAHLSAQAAGNPASKLKIIGITGTKGKTTTAYLLAHLLRDAGHRVALISSVENMIGSLSLQAPLTTPQPDYLHQFFKRCVDHDIEWVIMEVAAQAISLHRIDGIIFDAIMLTNIAREHLEFYPSMTAYVEAKLRFCSRGKKDTPIWVNGDDERLTLLKEVHRFGIHDDAVQLRGIHTPSKGFTLSASITHDGMTHALSSDALSGEYNLYNMLAAVAGALHVGIAWEQIQKGITTFTGVPGRLERHVLPNGAIAVIDYAHNPSSYQVLLSVLREQTDQLIVLFGAGGERDEGRRPEMGRIAAQYADRMILTTDNPRSEDPQQIITDILHGVPHEKRQKVHISLDRANGIRMAYEQSHSGAIIALLGKGREEYQLINRQKILFSERDVVRSFYRSRGVKAPF